LIRSIFGKGKKQSEKNTRIKKGKQPRVSNPNIVLIKQAVMILMLITEKHVKIPARRNRRIEPEVLYPIEKAAKRVRTRHKRPMIIRLSEVMNSEDLSLDKLSLVIVSFSISLTIDAPALKIIMIIARTSIAGIYELKSSAEKPALSAFRK
jgi:hypothetical protein